MTRTPRGSDLETFSRVADDLAGRVAAIVAARGLSLDQWRVLAVLAQVGPRSMSDLAGDTTITGPTLTRVVEALVERALVYRNVDAADRRRVLVHVADRGRALVEELAPAAEAAEGAVLAPLSSEELDMLRTLLERVSRRSMA